MATTVVTPPALTPIEQADLLGGFDALMKASKLYLDAEYAQNRIRGPEFSQVYLGSMQSNLAAAMNFLLQRQAANQEALVKAKQLALMDLQFEITEQQLLQALAQTSQINAQSQFINAQRGQIEAETALTVQKTDNALIEKDVLIAQKCKLQAEFDVLMLTKTKTTSETALLEQKMLTEKAQTTSLGVDADSVVGRQKQLFVAQTNGFARDAEQKAAKLWIDSWNVRRTTDETGTLASSTNKLDDASIGQVMTKLMQGIGL